MSLRHALPAVLTCVVAVPACGGRHIAPARPAPAAQLQDIDVSLFLIGDAGAPARPPAPEPVLVALRRAVATAPSPLIVYLGDNVYPRGLPEAGAPERREAERRLDEQLRVTRETGARTVFVPGNHDWRGGLPGVRRQQDFIRSGSGDLASLLPGDGCPGPAVVDMGATVRVIALDSQWGLQRAPPPRVAAEPARCAEDTPDRIVSSLRRAMRDAGGRVIVVVAHHPLRTGGPHGGHFGWEDHVFPLRAITPWLVIPLPVIGSLYPLLRASGISSQDVSSGAYQRMRSALDSAFASSPPLVFAAGHEHGLQVIAGSSARWVLVSGAGIYGHVSRLGTLDSTRYAHRASGFMRIDVLRDKRARLAVEQVDAAGQGSEAYSVWLQ
jgi:hypothetical protein